MYVCRLGFNLLIFFYLHKGVVGCFVNYNVRTCTKVLLANYGGYNLQNLKICHLRETVSGYTWTN